MNPRIIYTSKPFLVMEFIIFYVFLPFITTNFLDGWYKIIPLFVMAAVIGTVVIGMLLPVFTLQDLIR